MGLADSRNYVTLADVEALVQEDWDRFLTPALDRIFDKYGWLTDDDFDEGGIGDDLLPPMIAWLKRQEAQS